MGKFKEYWVKLQEIVDAHPKGKPYDKEGRFYPDPTPVAPPPGQSHVADIDMFEVMRSRIRNEASIEAQMHGFETFEEAEDFRLDDDPEPFSPYEEIVEQAIMDGPITRPEVNAALPSEASAPSQNAPAAAPAAPAAPKPGATSQTGPNVQST